MVLNPKCSHTQITILRWFVIVCSVLHACSNKSNNSFIDRTTGHRNRVTVHFTNTHCWSRRHGPLYFHTGETLRSIRSLQMEHYYIAALKPDTCGLCNVHDQAESDKPTEKVLAFLFLFYGMQLF